MTAFFQNVACGALMIVALSAMPARASVLFERSVRDYQATGPTSVQTGQTANVCITNTDQSPLNILIALMTADTSSLLASKQVTLQPGTGVCLAYTQGVNQQVAPGVLGVAVPNGHIVQQSSIVQDGPGGGCFVASLEISAVNPNNTAAQVLLHIEMQRRLDNR